MDAAAMAGTTQKGRLRQQILNGEQDIDALNERQAQAAAMPNVMQYGGMGPVGGGMGSGGMESRKASFTSQSGINRLFGRNKGNGAAFNDDFGEDIHEYSMGEGMSIEELKHIRDRGPYGLNASKTLDTTPFIPTIGAGTGSGPSKTVNNVQYRKQMNHSKKLALANGARAMSLAGSNPMMAPQMQSDPRAMSLSTFGGAGPRTMSLSSNGTAAPGGPRNMSLTNRGPVSPNYGMRQQGMVPQGMPPPGMMPQGMPSRNSMNYYPPQQYGPGPGPYQGPYQGPMPPQGPRTMSMNSNGSSMNGRPVNGPYMAPMSAPGQNYSRSMSMNNYSQHQQPMSPNMRSPQNSYGGFLPPSARMDYQQNSNDSLSNVLEEEESEDPSQNKNKNIENGDAVYHFNDDEDNATLSRKSTIKKSNSMRLRKLDLFNDENGNSNKGQLPSPDIGEGHNGIHDALSPTTEKLENGDDDVTLKDRGSPTNEDEINSSNSLKKMKHKSSLKSLVANTAFSNFRSPSKENVEVSKSKSMNSLVDEEAPDESKEADDYNAEDVSTGFNTSESLARSPDKSSINSKEIVEQSTPPTTNSSSNSQGFDTKAETTGDSSFAENQISTPDAKESPDRKSSRSFSISGKSKNLFKRLSKSGKRSSSFQGDDDGSGENTLKRNSSSFMNSSYASNMPAVNRAELQQLIELKPEDFDVVKRNNELLNELDLITTELASSIKRELALEFKLNDHIHSPREEKDMTEEITKRSDTITQLQEKLNKERRLRSIAEEHAWLLEKGETPSPLKLNYEKAELYKQLIIKNDTINQLQDKVNELEGKDNESPPDILERYNELLRENTDLKLEVIPELEKRISSLQVNQDTSSRNKQLTLVSDDFNDDYDHSYDEISILKSHRDELREVVAKLTSSHNFELKVVGEKYKNLQTKYKNLKAINDKLSRRLDNSDAPANTYSSNVLSLNKGGKLQGFSIVSPKRQLFDE